MFSLSLTDRRHSVCAACEISSRVGNEIATENVTMVPKQIHQGNSITGSQPGCMYNLPPNRPAMLFGRPLKIATTMNPMIIAIMFPKSLPRRLVNMPHRKTPRSDPYVYPNIPSTIGMMRTFGCTMMRYEVADATIIIRIENQTVAKRTARRLCSAVDPGLMYGSYQSRVKLVAHAFIAVLSDPIAVSNSTAIHCPRM